MQIGCNIKEDSLIINETNETIIQAKMSFHVRITLSDVNPKASRGPIAVGETVITRDEGTGEPQVLTSGVLRKYAEISYSLEAEAEEDEKMPNGNNNNDDSKESRSSEDSRNMGKNVNQVAIQQSRLRSKNANLQNDHIQRQKS